MRVGGETEGGDGNERNRNERAKCEHQSQRWKLGYKKKKVGTERNVFTSLHRQRRQRKCKNIFEDRLHFDFKLPKYTVEK